MMFKAADIGNTSIKLTAFKDGEVTGIERIGSIGDLAAKIGEGESAYCTTRRLTPQEREELLRVGAWELKGEGYEGLETLYRTPGTLGADRLAAVIGARYRYPGVNLLVADAGTALTLDAVNSAGVFLGGNISPGIRMRFEALHRFTSLLPMAAWEDAGERIMGDDTLSAIACGVKWGIINEISGQARLGCEAFGCSMVVLTGGDARRLMEPLRKVLPEDIKLELEDNLVAYGLMEAFRKRK